MEKLEDEASAADAELQERERVLLSGERRSPLDVEANDEAVQPVPVDVLDFFDPGIDRERGVCDEGLDCVVADVDVVLAGRFAGCRHGRGGGGFCREERRERERGFWEEREEE